MPVRYSSEDVFDAIKTPAHPPHYPSRNNSPTPAHPYLLRAAKAQSHAVLQLNRQRDLLFQRRRRNRLADLRAQRIAILRLAITPPKNPSATHAATHTTSAAAHQSAAAESPRQTPPPSAPRLQSPKYPSLRLRNSAADRRPAAPPPPHPSACFVVNSVAHHRLAFGPSSGYHFASGSPPIIFCSKQRRIRLLSTLRQLQHKLMEPRRALKQHLRSAASPAHPSA